MKLKEWQVIKQGQGTAAYLYLSSMRGLQSMQAIKNDAEAHIYLLRNNTFRRCRTEQSINHVWRPTDVFTTGCIGQQLLQTQKYIDYDGRHYLHV